MDSTPSVTSSQSTQGWTWDVFLNFRGLDTRKTFVDYLYTSLDSKGIRTFKDDDRIKKGNGISPALLEAIKESRFFIPIFSKDYASSKWCLEELAEIMECQKKLKQKTVVPIFYDVEPSDVRNQRGSFKNSFAKHQKKFKDDKGKVRRWRKALKKAGGLKGHHLQNDYNGYEAKCAQKVTADILIRLNHQSNEALLDHEKKLVGLESRVDNIGELLGLKSNDIRFIGIYGMGGIGKTTIAMSVFKKFSNKFGGGACFLDISLNKGNIIELQKTLVTTVLNERSPVHIPTVLDGMDMIKNRLSGKKVLIVLDHVDDCLDQLEKLAGGHGWFGEGSRVIIITRDRGVLRSRVDEKYIYEVRTLEEEEALKLFRLYALQEPNKTDMEELCGSIVGYCKGLPLALTVLGSSLCGLGAADWKNTLMELERNPNGSISETLAISFNRLDPKNKEMFLHISCFFRNRREEDVKDVLESDLRLLTEKCLISVKNGKIEMHDLIQQMGWWIARQEQPRKRVWLLEDVNDVLMGRLEPKDIEGIILFPSGPPSTDDECHNDENISNATFKAFEHMKKLKILIIDGDVKIFHDMDNYLCSSELRWLDFKNCDFTSLQITKNFRKLTYLGLSESYSSSKTPSFTRMPNLKRLNLSHCSKLKGIDSSLGNLKKLVSLNLRGCFDLEKLPSFNQLSSLKFLDLRYCEKLNFFPEIKTKLLHLVELDLEGVGIKELPSSIQQLHGLTKLCLIRCENLVCLSTGLCMLKKLEVLKITFCSEIKSLPLNGLTSLKYLNLQGSGFVSLPKSFTKLCNLQYLDITSCRNLEKLRKLPASMKELYVDCHFGCGSNIFELAIKCLELYSISFYCEDEFEVGTSLAMKFIPFPLYRNNPFSFSYPLPKADILRSFKYRCYGAHNGISINLDNSWYSKNFWGFAICFRPLTGDMWEPHSYQDIDGRMEHCVIKAKLSHKDDKDTFLQKECVIVGSKALGFYIYGHMCFVNIPFTSLMRGRSNKTTMDGVIRPNDYSRFEVAFRNLEASAYYWGCSLLYHERKKKKKKKWISISRVSCKTLENEVNCEIRITGLQVPQNVCTLVPTIGSIACIGSITCITPVEIEDYTNFMWTNLASWDFNLPGGTTKIGHLSECISGLHHYHYLDCNNEFRRCETKHQLPANMRELYACHTLASESNIAELASKYSELYSVSFSHGLVDLTVPKLAKEFSHITGLLLNRNTPFAITYTTTDKSQRDINMMRWFKYSSRASNKISVDLDPNWYNQNFLGFVVCFLFSGREIWKSDPNIRPFRHCEIIAKLAHKDDGNKVLLKKCMIGRLYNEEFDFTFGDRRLVCFAYIPFSSLWNESKSIMDNATPNHYSLFEVTFLDLEVSTNWSCDLLYTTEAMRRKWEQEHADAGSSDSGLDKTKLWQLTKMVHLAQSEMESTAGCSNTKVVQLLYTNSGVGILALSSNGILKLWKCSHDDQNSSTKHWNPNSGSSMTDNVEAIPCMALSKDDSYVVSTSGEHVSLFSIMEFKVMKTFTWLECATTFLAFHPHDNYTIAIGTENSTIYIWDVRTDKARLLQGHLKCITGLAFSTNCNILVSSGADARLCAWSIDTWQETISVSIRLRRDKVDAGDKQPTQVMFHADQVHLLVIHETQLAIYDASNKMERIRRWVPHGSLSAPISSATYSCNGQLVYASFKDGNIGVLDADTLRPRCHIAPSAYLSKVISNRSEAAFPVVIAAHPEEPIQFAVGLTDGSVKVIQLLKSQVEWEVPSPQNNEILNEDNAHGFGKVIFDDDVSIDEEFSDEELHMIERLPKYSGEPKFLPYGLMASTSSQTSRSHPRADGNRLSAIASQSTQRRTYDVFLSFRGLDTCKTFIDDLYGYLERKGIRTFKDEDRLDKEDCISPSLLKAIQESKFLIAVFSEGYASSKWCLDELATIMDHQEKLKEQIVVPIFYYVEPSDVWNQNGSFGDSFKELVEKIGKDDEEKVRRWKEALKKAGNLKGHHLQNNYNGYEATCAENVAADIHARLNQASLAFEKNLVGLESRVNNIINWSRLASDDDVDSDARFIGICGMGGIGKTTIAMVVFNRFSHQFDGACFLADVRRHDNIIELQETLLAEVLKEKSGVQISNVQDEKAKIWMRLKGKKVLIVLDDVDHVEHLEKLAGGGDWFGKGSRVIITTRDAEVLRSHGVDEKYICQVDTLKEQEAIQLFSWYAFKKKIPKTDFEELCGSIVRYAMGLPLALKVLGSYLCGLKAVYWENILVKLKDSDSIYMTKDKVLEVLRISFDGLDPKNQNVFLHIACFLRNWREEVVKDVVESDLLVLIEKSLISVQNGEIEMHDRIQEMGWYIASKEKPRKMVWQLKDVGDVLSGKMEQIEGIELPDPWPQPRENITFEITLRGMRTLKILKVHSSIVFPISENYLPSSLRWLEFDSYHFDSLPESFASPKLVGLSLRKSSLQNCRITQELSKLTYLNLSSSYSLLETPNFDMMPHLKKLYLSDCEKLVEIHSSVGRLEKLVLLDLSSCGNLKRLPRFIRVPSLKFLKLEYCSQLENFPEIQANMPLVRELILESIGIRELPSSIGQLSGLTVLHLIECNYLVSLSDGLCELESLELLELRDCCKLESLPENLGNLSNLKKLFIFDTAIFQLPPSITRLSLLECLCWGGNEEIQEIDEGRSLKFVPSVAGLRSLKRLQLSDFNIIDEGLPSDLEYLVSLEYLSLRRSDFVDLPESFSQLPRLKYLDIKGCRQLKKLPETTREEEEQPDLPKLPESTTELYADSRFASRRNITKLLAECPELHAVAFSDDGNDPCMGRPEYFLARMCIRFPLPRIPRETPFSVSYSVAEESADESLDAGALRLFQYRCYQSNGISIDLTNHSWYSNRFVGFAVYFFYSGFDIWGPHSYEDIHCVERCTVIAKLSHNNNRNKEDPQRECVIVNADDYTCEEIKVHICFAYIPFSSLCPESSTNTKSVTAKDFSRFEVKFKNLEATAEWGCSFLYQWKKPANRKDICSCTHTLPSRNSICRECSTDDWGPPWRMLKYMNLSRLNLMNFNNLPEFISRFRVIQYLDMSGCAGFRELPEFPLTIKELYAPYNRSLASENNITELATKYSKLSSVSFSFSMHDNDDRAFLKPGELAEKFIPITQPFLNRNTPFAVSYPSDIMWSDDYKIGKCFKYSHNDSNKISISLDPTWYNHSFVGFVVCFQFPIKVRWESHPAILPFRHCELIAKLTHKDNGSEPDPLQTKCVIGRLYDEEFYDHFEDRELVCFAYIPFSSLWPKYEVITDTTTPNRYSVFEAAFQDSEAAFQDSEISKHFDAQDWGISTDWSCGLLYTDDKSLIEELQQKRENGSSESDSEEEEEEEEEDDDYDDGSQHEDDAMTEDNNLGHSAESPIDISDDGSEPSEHGDSGKEGESIDCDEDVDEFESDAGHSSGTAMAKHRGEMQSNEVRGIRVKRCGVETCIGSPPTKKRTHGLSLNVPFDGDEDGAGHGVEVAMSKYNDSVNEKGKEREDEQREKVRLNNDKTPSSSKQNRKIRDQSDELSLTGTQPPIVGDDVFQQMWDNFNCLLASFPPDEEYIELEIDQTIFHHTDMCTTFILINDIKDMMKMNFLEASIIKLFILFLNRLCNQFQVTSIGFVCPVQISMNEVKQNVPDITDITPYLTHVMEQHKDKQFILAPYLQKSHWLLLVICIRSKSVYVLDPLPHNRTIEIKNSLNRALHSVSTNERNINWKQCKCPIQPGVVECGYYVMRYMFDIVTKYSSFECLDEAFESNNQYSINEINEIRDLWAKYFLEECIGISVHST